MSMNRLKKKDNMDAISSFALASGLSWASGLRLYATVFCVGLLAKYGYIHVPNSFKHIEQPNCHRRGQVFLMVVEFFGR